MSSFNTSVDFPKEFKDDGLLHKLSLLSTETSSCASPKEKSNVATVLPSSNNQTSSQKEPIDPEHSQTTNTAVEGLEMYPMTRAKRGICLIVNNNNFSNSIKPLKSRDGTIIDEKSLEIVFKWLGFEIEIKRDCTRDEMLSVVQELSSRDHSQMDCVVCCILSHGLEESVYGVDGQTVELGKLREPFSGLQCQSLVEKPKLFFIQACQGIREQEAVAIEADGPVSCCVHSDAFGCEDSIPSHADFLMSKATVLHHVSFRDKKRGSWFIQSLCRNLIELVPRGWDLLFILTKVNADVSRQTNLRYKTKQMPQPEFSLRKRVVFPVPSGAPPSLPW
ncbi:hypothetical protein LDENG_00102320 [Lucifuga dentata]|nr:hypothetical protein LDENG_00102320 [Lucifuga dentata]